MPTGNDLPTDGLGARNRRPIVAVVMAVLLIATAFYFRNFLFYENLHPVIEGQIYRSAQPTAAGLQHAIDSIGLRTVLNLKGSAPDDNLESGILAISKQADLNLRFVRLSARRWPSPQEVEQLIDAIDTSPRPLLIHCQGGTDRSGLASAIALLLGTDDLTAAEAQFALRYGYPGESLGSDLPGFLTAYRAWLAARDEPHSASRFRDWVATDYIAYYYEAEIEFAPPERGVDVGEAFTMRVRVINRSTQPIPLHCEAGAGVRLSMRLRAVTPNPHNLGERRFCATNMSLAAGEQIEIETDTYLIQTPGTYQFTADLVDENREQFFADMGSVITSRTLVVR